MYKQPPAPGACKFTKKEIAWALNNNGLLRIGIELGLACNLKCRYCYADAGQPTSNEISTAEIRSIILQAKDMGALYVAIVSGGEPLLRKELFEIIDFINAQSLKATLFTNCTLITKEIAKELFKRDLFITGKLNSLNNDLEDWITGAKDAGDRIKNGVNNLIEAGFITEPYNKNTPTRLALHTLVCKQNFNELTEIFVWCRERNIIPYMQLPVQNGRMWENLDMKIFDKQIKELYFSLLDIDRRKYGYDWKSVPPNAGWACQQRVTSCYINSVGDVQPCNSVTLSLGNIRKQKLRDIIASAEFRKNRNLMNINGPCQACELLGEDCYGGCMADCYQRTGNLLSSDMRCWRN